VFGGIYAVITAARPHTGRPFTWLDWLYTVSYFKVAISLMKYIPQVLLNARRHSTVGWSIHNVLLDITGGVLSVLQLVLDCANTRDWSGIAGTPVKFALGCASIFFDVIFLVQHFWLYRGASASEQQQYGDGYKALLHDNGEVVV
jgi:cystinosin